MSVNFSNLGYSKQSNANSVLFRGLEENVTMGNLAKATVVPTNPMYKMKKNLTTKGLLYSSAIGLSTLSTISSFVKRQKTLGWLSLGATLAFILASNISIKRAPKEYYKPEYLEKIDYKA